MAGDNVNVWYDPEGDHLEIVFDQKVGQFEETSDENVMHKRDSDGNLLAVSIFNLSSFAKTGAHRESSSGHGLWLTFNLDIDDPDSFDFDVAFGYERLGDISEDDPEYVAPPDASAMCSVFFHTASERPRPEAVAHVRRFLEIIHKPPSRELVSIGTNPMSPVTLTSLCHDQLLLALRLFQPQRFLVFPCERRHEGRAWAYRELLSGPNGPPAPYVLRGHQVTRFCEFARKLQAFHVVRNLYRGIRRDPVGAVVLPLAMPPDDPGGTRFFKRVSRLMIATDLFEQANEGHALPREIRMMWLVMAAEALFTDDDKSEVSYRLSTRMAILNGANPEDVKHKWELVRAMYDARSRLMHGTGYVGKASKRLPELVGDSGFIEPTPERLLAFNNLVRSSLLYFIALKESDQWEALEILDRAVFDPSEVAGLRKFANNYWGFADREDEVLCSGRWTI